MVNVTKFYIFPAPASVRLSAFDSNEINSVRILYKERLGHLCYIWTFLMKIYNFNLNYISDWT